MSRKKELTWETEQEFFPTKLRELMREHKITQKELAEFLGVRPQTVSLYATGQSAPDIHCLKKMAEFFNVSSDYLLGLAKEPTNDPDITAACVTTGLSASAVEWLQTAQKEHTEYLDILNTLLERKELVGLLLSSMYLYAMSTYTKVKFIDSLTDNERNFDLSESKVLIKSEAQDSFSLILDDLRSIYGTYTDKMMEDKIRIYELEMELNNNKKELEVMKNGQHHKND